MYTPMTGYGFELTPGDEYDPRDIPVCCDENMTPGPDVDGDDRDHTCGTCGTTLVVRDGLVADIHTEIPETIRLTADVVATTPTGRVLLIERGWEPHAGHWALPGGWVDAGETAREAARRELEEETGVRVDPADLVEIGTWHAPGRDPRGRFVTVAHHVVVPDGTPAVAGDDARTARWWPLDGLPPQLAFDHAEIVRAVAEVGHAYYWTLISETDAVVAVGADDIRARDVDRAAPLAAMAARVTLLNHRPEGYWTLRIARVRPTPTTTPADDPAAHADVRTYPVWPTPAALTTT
ncbi:NUDIX domain-containing protein [Embleya sp. NPDC020630]|uniref:NUDIX domain-containing protein n=1 Tax=Embleya sp. NPDC020630 TaxID=3363979 RepID=UPI0037B71F2B